LGGALEMSDNFTQAYLLLAWSYTGETPSYKYAFVTLLEGYEGGRVTYAKDISRNPAGTLLVVRAPANKREFTGRVVLDHNATGTVVYDEVTYTFGTDTNLKSAMEATDLKARSFEDSAFWSAESIGDWDPRVEFDPMGNVRVQVLRLVEK
jgi:hypothetical protein